MRWRLRCWRHRCPRESDFGVCTYFGWSESKELVRSPGRARVFLRWNIHFPLPFLRFGFTIRLYTVRSLQTSSLRRELHKLENARLFLLVLKWPSKWQAPLAVPQLGCCASSRRGGRRLAAASRPGRGRLAAARCAAPLPRAPPLPPRSLPTCKGVIALVPCVLAPEVFLFVRCLAPAQA